MKRVAVLGGGPAGAFAAARLSAAGLSTVLLDEKLAWEKPCGGGLTFKAYDRYPFLTESTASKHFVQEAVVSAPNAGESRMFLKQPLVIYSRLQLNQMLLERAAQAGARIEKERVLAAERHDSGWRIRTRSGTLDADYCIVATGARNPLKNVGTEFTPADTMVALGYYIPAAQNRIDIQFLPHLEGYIWIFPRCGHLSAGICGKGESAQSLRARLERYLQEHAIDFRGAQFYAHLLPALASSSWKKNRIAGDGWLAAGDAAGLVDPITGEGLYYALRSGDLAAETILSHEPARCAGVYRNAIHDDFAADLAFGATLARRVYLGTFLSRSVPDRMVQFMRRSPRFHDLMQDLFAGTQPYLELRNRLLRNLNGTLYEVVMNFFLQRLVTETDQVRP